MIENIRFSDTLYGRNVERKKLLSLLMSAAANNPASIFISGSPGTGKTLLAKSILNEIQDAGGIFATGKFDQYKRDLPYSAFRDALRNIVRSLLLYNEARLNEIKKLIINSHTLFGCFSCNNIRLQQAIGDFY
jgi:predicted ATPase